MKGTFIIFPLDVALYNQILPFETFPVASEFDFDDGLLKAMFDELRDILGPAKVLELNQLKPYNVFAHASSHLRAPSQS